MKAHVTSIKADKAKANIMQAQGVIERERQVLQTYLAEQEIGSEIVAMLGRGTLFKKK